MTADAARATGDQLTSDWQAVFEAISSPIFVMQVPDRLTAVNHAGLDILGVHSLADIDSSISALQRRHPIETLEGRRLQRERRPSSRALRGEQFVNMPIRYRDVGEETHELLASGGPIPIEPGTPARSLVICRDVTNLRRLEHARLEVEQSRDDFLAAITHDLRQPLATILGNAGLARRRQARGDLDPQALSTFLQRIDEAGRRLAAQLDDLLDTVHLRAGRTLSLVREPVDLVELVRDTVQAYEDLPPAHVVSCAAMVPHVVIIADRLRLQRMFGNLLGNALKYSPEGRHVHVVVGCEREPSEEWAVVSVHDQGLGIPAAALPHIFEPFYRASNVASIVAGSGLGLASAKQTVEQHGGTIAVESTEDRGTTFTVRLPLRPD